MNKKIWLVIGLIFFLTPFWFSFFNIGNVHQSYFLEDVEVLAQALLPISGIVIIIVSIINWKK